MEKYYGENQVNTAPTVPTPDPTDKFPTNGDSGSAIPATTLDAYAVYQLVEELNNLIVDAGLTPAIGTLTQVLDAIDAKDAALLVGLGTGAYGDIGTDIQAHDDDNALLDVAQIYTAGQRGEVTTLTDGATIPVDLALSNNFTVELGGNRTLENPTNAVAGQSGIIVILQDSSGSQTLSYSANYEFAGGTAPTLSTSASAKDVLYYYVESSTEIHIASALAWA